MQSNQVMQEQRTSRAIVLAAVILGGSIVLAAIIFASSSNRSLSMFSRWSMSNQLDTEVKRAFAGNVTVAGTRCRLVGFTLVDAKLRQDGDTLVLTYDAAVLPLEKVSYGETATEGHVFGESILSKQASQSYSGVLTVGDSSANVTLR